MITITLQIKYSDLHRSKFDTVENPYNITHNRPLIYLHEKNLVEMALFQYEVSYKDIISITYISGLTKPYGYTGSPATYFDYYTIIIKLSENPEQPKKSKPQEKIFKETDRQMIQRKFMVTPQKERRKLYRELAMMYHPDKPTGSLELMKYINSLKDMYL